MFDPAKADRAVRFIQELKHTKSPFFGLPFELLDWQLPIIRDVYGTMTRGGLRQYQIVYIEIPKKQGKSELGAAFALYQLFGDHEINGEVYGCAGTKGQASLVFDVVDDMIGQSPELKKRAKVTGRNGGGLKKITDKKTGTFYRVESAEAYSKHGYNLSACIFDELHVQPNRHLWDVMTDGAGDARAQPLWIVITTAGDDPDRTSICWEVHQQAVDILKARESHNKAKDLRTWYPVIYSYEGDDIYNEKNWAKANPSLGITVQIEKMRNAAAEAKLSPAKEHSFRWLRLNQWTTSKLTGWLPLELFDATNARGWSRADLLGKKCYPGLDLSSTTDLSALCTVFPPQDGLPDWRVIWDAWIPENNMADRIKQDHVPYDAWAAGAWITPTPGDVVDYTVIEDRILEIKSLYKIMELGADKTFAGELLQRMTKAGITCVDVPQTYATLTDPMNFVEIMLKSKIPLRDEEGKIVLDDEGKPTPALDEEGKALPMLTHELHPVARWCFGNTSIHTNGNQQIKYVKETRGAGTIRTKRIDLTAAWIIAMVRAKLHPTRPDLARILKPDYGM